MNRSDLERLQSLRQDLKLGDTRHWAPEPVLKWARHIPEAHYLVTEGDEVRAWRASTDPAGPVFSPVDLSAAASQELGALLKRSRHWRHERETWVLRPVGDELPLNWSPQHDEYVIGGVTRPRSAGSARRWSQRRPEQPASQALKQALRQIQAMGPSVEQWRASGLMRGSDSDLLRAELQRRGVRREEVMRERIAEEAWRAQAPRARPWTAGATGWQIEVSEWLGGEEVSREVITTGEWREQVIAEGGLEPGPSGEGHETALFETEREAWLSAPDENEFRTVRVELVRE